MQKLALKYKNSSIAYLTVALTVFTVSLYLVSAYLYLEGSISYTVCLILLSLCSYIIFTPMHEAAHGNISGNSRSLQYLNSVIGYISAIFLFVPYKAFKVLHLQHHSFTNDKEKDPDYWVATSNYFMLLLKASSITLHYYYFVIFKPSSALKKQRVNAILTLALYFIACAAITKVTNSYELMSLWVGSSIIGITLLAIVFDWLPHAPYLSKERYTNTRIIDKKILTIPLLFQNYHLSHHLYPRVPFYNYEKVFQEIKVELHDKNAVIIN